MNTQQHEIVVDFSNLRAIAGDDDSFVVALLMKMCKALPLAFTNMAQYVQAQDWPALKSAAHKAKSTFAYLSLDDMRDRLKAIEHQSMEGLQLESLPRQVEEAITLGQRILRVLEVELARLS